MEAYFSPMLQSRCIWIVQGWWVILLERRISICGPLAGMSSAAASGGKVKGKLSFLWG